MHESCLYNAQLTDTQASAENATQTGSQKLYKWITKYEFNTDFIKVFLKPIINFLIIIVKMLLE